MWAWIIGGLIVLGIIGALSDKSESSSSSSSSNDTSSKWCNHEWGEWFKSGKDFDQFGNPVLKKRRCKKCGEVDIFS